MNQINGLTARIERLKRFIDLEAPAFIMAFAYHMALELAEKLNSSRLGEIQAIGKKLSSPEFDLQLSKVIREANLKAAGFCTNTISIEGKGAEVCMEQALPDNSLCASCWAAFEEEMKADEAYDASPEGQKEIAEYEAMQEEDDSDD